MIPDAFWSEELFSLLLSCIMDPASLGFDMSDVEIVTKLPEQVRRDFAVKVLFACIVCFIFVT